ncbi:uncharacterized protein LOC122252726 isoform X2 [Penaeus japonicus]|nr:uncharacterized protein LOC122252726 isoform X2 [Penaeus japonicus]XP_042871278.1 uncharacterized protein LOC122252726 isoform X2 [Penaeus japonicus]XP_042871279.1 uncharacterized protein LOC122252726 isoform X2 [Penaeus japonicus]
MMRTAFLILCFLCCLTRIECIPKVACNQTADCQSATEECVDQVCECQDNHYIAYTSDLKVLCKQASRCAPGCQGNQVCFGGHCKCASRMLSINDECRTVSDFKEECSSYTALCDISSNLSCARDTCACIKSHWFNNETGSCKHKLEYLTANNITEYKVRPGVYCRTPGDCITGLNCTDFLCTCPESCEYHQDKEVCDCGDDGVSVVWPTVVGIFLGATIVFCWIGAITATFPE